jgi:hypothetical protein
VLPCYLADQDPALRPVMDALVELFQRHGALLEGRPS